MGANCNEYTGECLRISKFNAPHDTRKILYICGKGLLYLPHFDYDLHKLKISFVMCGNIFFEVVIWNCR